MLESKIKTCIREEPYKPVNLVESTDRDFCSPEMSYLSGGGLADCGRWRGGLKGQLCIRAREIQPPMLLFRKQILSYKMDFLYADHWFSLSAISAIRTAAHPRGVTSHLGLKALNEGRTEPVGSQQSLTLGGPLNMCTLASALQVSV